VVVSETLYAKTLSHNSSICFDFAHCVRCPRINLFSDAGEPLKEFTLEGRGSDKILLIPMHGIITDTPKERFLARSQNIVENVVSQLKKAEKDDRIKAVLFEINSPGGTITASDLLYYEISSFKERTSKKIAVSMVDIATSGAYYVSLRSRQW
jgi:protease-4